MSRAGIMTLVVILVVAAMVWFALQGAAEVECTVCMTWNGETRCQESAGTTQEEAVNRARTAICQLLTHSRADNIKCGRQEPDSIECY
jgi:hypothetical protein